MTRVNYTIHKHKADIFEAITDKDRKIAYIKEILNQTICGVQGLTFFKNYLMIYKLYF